jgi:L-ascorbate metabolism protein UlaG (beta-lactamase superfamily)
MVYVYLMEIVYLGHSAFKLKGKSSSVVTDPYNEKAGKFPKDVDANIVTVTHDHPDHNEINKVGGNPFVISGPGEYEVGGVSVIGIATFHDEKNGSERGLNTAYVIEMEGLRVLHLGDLGHKLTQPQLEEIGAIDVALVPVGGFYTIDAKTASEVVKQVDPWVVIPMHYQQPGLDPTVFEKLTGVEEFLKEMGKAETLPVPKYSITADKLPPELQVVVLERK